MEVRITFRSEIVVEGNDLEDVKQKFEGLNLCTKEGNGNFVELVSVEDNDTYRDLMEEWDELY